MESVFFRLELFGEDRVKKNLALREGETRLGEKVVYRAPDSESWKNARFHVLGIVEDLGPRLNGGFGGADKAFDAFISRFLNAQSNEFLVGDSICVHGTIELKAELTDLKNEYVDDLDSIVASWTKEVVGCGGIPVVIGGGHNNAFGLINGVSRALGSGISVVNLDPHADVRKTGARHSGNPFSTANENGTLSKYTVLGLHQSYNNQFILDYLREMKAETCFFEDWIDDPKRFYRDVENVFSSYKNDHVGVELDMDAIAYMPTSAYTPSGITVEQARYYVRKMATLKNTGYLHLPEAAPSTVADEKSVGKALCYLVTDFIKCRSNV